MVLTSSRLIQLAETIIRGVIEPKQRIYSDMIATVIARVPVKSVPLTTKNIKGEVVNRGESRGNKSSMWAISIRCNFYYNNSVEDET